jgi:biotin carboxylase
MREVVLCKWQPELVVALLDAGARLHLVLDRFDRFERSGDAADRLLARCAHVYEVGSLDSLEELGAVAVDLRMRGARIEQVVSYHELGMSGARHLEQLLGLRNDPLRSVSHRDKRLMKERVRAAGVLTARFVSVTGPGDADGLAAVARQLRAPVVVKPAAGYGSLSTVKVDDVHDVAGVVDGLGFDPVQRSRQLIVEEFVDGTELAIDATWSRGRVLSFVVHRYHEARMTMNRAAGLDGSVILAERDHPELYERLLEVHERVNRALGITDWATHMEVFIRPCGEIVFSEVANRVGGGWIFGMLTAYFGRPVWQVLAEVALSGTCPVPEPRREHLGAVHIGPAQPGRITEIPDDAELAAEPGVLSWWKVRGPGDRARMSHPSDYCLHVVLGADTAAGLDALCRHAAERFTIATEPV